MMKTRTLTAAILCLTGVAWIAPVQAQDAPAAPAVPATPAQNAAPPVPATDEAKGKLISNIELTRDNIRTRRKEIINQQLSLGPEESAKFWPVYRQYQEDVAKLNDQQVENLAAYLQNYDNLSDDKASEILDRFLFLRQKYADARKVYVNKFKATLPNRKVLRLYQLEDQMDAAVNYQLAGNLPLAK